MGAHFYPYRPMSTKFEAPNSQACRGTKLLLSVYKWSNCSWRFMQHVRSTTCSPVRYVFSFWIFGDLEKYTFLETLGPTESERQCLHFFQAPYGRYLGFSKWRLFFLLFQLIIILDTWFWCLYIHFKGHVLSLAPYKLSHWIPWPRKCMCRHQNHVSSMTRSWDIAVFQKKIVAILKIKDGCHRTLGKNVNIVFRVQ